MSEGCRPSRVEVELVSHRDPTSFLSDPRKVISCEVGLPRNFSGLQTPRLRPLQRPFVSIYSTRLSFSASTKFERAKRSHTDIYPWAPPALWPAPFLRPGSGKRVFSRFTRLLLLLRRKSQWCVGRVLLRHLPSQALTSRVWRHWGSVIKMHSSVPRTAALAS